MGKLLDPSKVQRKYTLVIPRKEFHLTNTDLDECQPETHERLGYSDSSHALVSGGNLPCRWCLPDINVKDIKKLKQPIKHEVYQNG